MRKCFSKQTFFKNKNKVYQPNIYEFFYKNSISNRSTTIRSFTNRGFSKVQPNKLLEHPHWCKKKTHFVRPILGFKKQSHIGGKRDPKNKTQKWGPQEQTQMEFHIWNPIWVLPNDWGWVPNPLHSLGWAFFLFFIYIYI